MLFEHREESDTLLGRAVRVNDGLFNEFVERALAEKGMRGSLPRSCRLRVWYSRHDSRGRGSYAAAWRRKLSAQPLGVS
jgi:hypothetical protein